MHEQNIAHHQTDEATRRDATLTFKVHLTRCLVVAFSLSEKDTREFFFRNEVTLERDCSSELVCRGVSVRRVVARTSL